MVIIISFWVFLFSFLPEILNFSFQYLFMGSVKAILEEVKLYIEKADEATLKLVHAMLEAKGSKKDKIISELGCSTDEYNREIDEAMVAIDRGEFYTHEEAKKKFAEWDKKHLKKSSGTKKR